MVERGRKELRMESVKDVTEAESKNRQLPAAGWRGSLSPRSVPRQPEAFRDLKTLCMSAQQSVEIEA